MSESINPLSGNEVAAIQGQAAENASKSGTLNASTTIPNNIAALQTHAPEMARLLEQSMAMTIIGQMRRGWERIKEQLREARNRRY